MLFKLRLFFIINLLLISCKNIVREETTSNRNPNHKEKSMEVKLQLVSYPEDLMKENGLEEWEEFKNLYESLERMKELDFRDIEVNVLALSSRIKNLLSKQMPGGFETPQIRSRMKVVQMQTQKVKYFTRYYKKDSLIPSLKNLYEQYNSVIDRMLTLREEETATNFVSDY
tara:strand:+ start:53 stop:565 length:513 start_codon:yes stop_codon:yes gene_type:complete